MRDLPLIVSEVAGTCFIGYVIFTANLPLWMNIALGVLTLFVDWLVFYTAYLSNSTDQPER